MQDACVQYGADGLYIVCNSRTTTNTWAKNYWETNGCTWLHNFHGDINATVWYNYGYPGSIPYKVTVDMDGNIRKTGHWLHEHLPIALQCLGVAE